MNKFTKLPASPLPNPFREDFSESAEELSDCRLGPNPLANQCGSLF